MRMGRREEADTLGEKDERSDYAGDTVSRAPRNFDCCGAHA
jgi:hypothetical protein